MSIDLQKLSLKEPVIRLAYTTLLTSGIVVGLFWTIVRPYAQGFVEQTIAEQSLVSSKELDDIRKQLMELGESGESIQSTIELLKQSDVKYSVLLESIEKQQDESSRDIKLLLQGIGSINRQLSQQ